MRAFESFRKNFAAESLQETFIHEVSLKPTVGIDCVTVSKFNESLEDNVAVISRKVLDGRFSFTNYAQVLVTKGPGKSPRELCIPTVRDKLVMKALSHVLDDVFGDICMTPQPQKVVDEVEAAIKTGKYDSFVKLDVHGFYSHIDHRALMRCLKSKIRKREILSLVDKAISTKSVAFGQSDREKREIGIPEGLPISNRLANLYLSKLGSLFAGSSEIAVFRYVDDILLLGSSNGIGVAECRVNKYLSKMGLTLSKEKTRRGKLAEDPFDYLGYRFDKGELFVGLKAKRSIESALERSIANECRRSDPNWLWHINSRITGFRVTYDGEHFRRFGWLYYYSRQSDVAYLARLDSLVRKIARRKNLNLPNGLKSFKKTYYEMKYREGKSKYLQTIDMTMSVPKMRNFLETQIGINTRDYKDEEIPVLLNKVIRREASMLERDVGITS